MLNVVREEILHKGFVCIKDIQKFIPCGYQTAKKVFDKLKKEAEVDNKLSLDGRVSAKRLVKYVYLTEKQIYDFARLEKLEALTSTKDS